MARLELRGVRKSFQAVEVIHGVDLTVESGAFAVFVGPSGCGKSTLLRMIAGLEDVTAGEIRLDGERCEHLLPSRRGMAMVFQSYALYPHMSVRENLRFGLVCHKVPKAEIAKRIARAANILQIEHLLERQPSQLSGGQSQRVAIGRAIVKEPKAFLFDEPLSNLDAELRVKMRGEIAALHRRLGATMIYVTHDQVEAMTMADVIVVLREGVVEQIGSPVELYVRPRNRFVACFLGTPQMNLLAADAVAAGAHGLELAVDQGRARIAANVVAADWTSGARLTAGLRPEHLSPTDAGPLAARVEASEVLGAETIIHAVLQSGERLSTSVRGLCRVSPGEPIRLSINPTDVHVFNDRGEALPRAIPAPTDPAFYLSAAPLESVDSDVKAGLVGAVARVEVDNKAPRVGDAREKSMTAHGLKEMAQTKSPKFGHFIVEFATPGIGHILKSAGCDFVLFDLEHSGFGFETVKSAIRYFEAADLPVIVRVPSKEYHHIARAMDMGAEGLMLPMVGNVDEARHILKSMKYTPHGGRGVALQVSHDRYRPGSVVDKFVAANRRSTFFCQIETAEGVENADAIAALPGVDCLWVGHFDLSVSLGVPGEFGSKTFTDAIARVAEAARKHGKSLGRLVPTVQQGVDLFGQGFDFICYSGDVWVLHDALKDAIDKLREGCVPGEKPKKAGSKR